MGQYVCYDGTIEFKKKKDYKKFVKEITENGWYNPELDSWSCDDGWINEGLEPDDIVPVLVEGDGIYLVILPNYSINNFHRVFNCLIPNTWEGEIRGTSDDGDLVGYILRPDGEEEGYCLETWAKEHNKTLTRDEDNEDWLCEDRHDVMESFIENPFPPKNSTKFIMDQDEN